MAKRKRNTAPKELMEYLFQNYELKNALDVQEALKDMFSETLETMLNAELDEHLGYSKSENNIGLEGAKSLTDSLASLLNLTNLNLNLL